MREPNTLYRHRQPKQPLDIVRASELAEAICYAVRTLEPEHPEAPEGEWYCSNESCVVREVRVRCKLFGERRPMMKCPACGQRLTFHHWLGSRLLVPVRQPDPGEGA
jgi:hypothetical protein